MTTTKRQLPINTAVAVGVVIVNMPVFLLIFGPALIAAANKADKAVLPLLFLGFVLAWTWWSVSVPRWRLWAYERVASTGALHQRAILVGLIWPKGSIFERTEFVTHQQRARREQLEREFP